MYAKRWLPAMLFRFCDGDEDAVLNADVNTLAALDASCFLGAFPPVDFLGAAEKNEGAGDRY